MLMRVAVLKMQWAMMGVQMEPVYSYSSTSMAPKIASGMKAVSYTHLDVYKRQLYAEALSPEAFLDKTIVPEWYAARDFHKMDIVEILNVWVKE